MSLLAPTSELNTDVVRVDGVAPQIHLRLEANIAATLRARFYAPFLSGDEPVCVGVELPPNLQPDEVSEQIPPGLITREFRGGAYRLLLMEGDGFSAILELSRHGARSCTIRAASSEAAALAEAEVREWFPITEPPVDRVPISFWQQSGGMYTTVRPIEAPGWADVAHHYPGEVGEALDALFSTELESPDGRIILWHGPPGTGKTSAIRALARTWREQAGFEIVLDPEPVFSKASNLLEVVLHESDHAAGSWRVLVIEDADEIVRADNDRASQSLSRLLNIGDGIVGQGLRVLVLLTTNESPDRLHPALSRPGRCLSQIAFRHFTRTEAEDTFPGRELTGATDDLSLAEILTGRSNRQAAASPGQYL